jgi:energy-coupling factor transporter ATP-binding protein EcfA2
MPYLSSKLYECKNRFGLIGPVGSGKSTIAAMLGLVTQTLSSIRQDFYCRILERNSNIYGDISNIRAGYFPEKTVAFDNYATEAGFLFARKSNLPFGGYKKLQMPICDVAGETLQMNIRQYAQTREPLTGAQMSAAKSVTQYVKQSEGIIVAADASRVMLGRGFKNVQVKTEDDKFLHRDPDVNLVRLLNDIFDYREQIKKPLKAVAIMITKWDELKLHVEHQGINIMNPDQADLSLFMDTWFPSVSQCVKAYALDHPQTQVKYFPTFIEVERDDQNEPKKWDDEHIIIKAKVSEEICDWRKPACSEEVYTEFIDWLLGFAV